MKFGYSVLNVRLPSPRYSCRFSILTSRFLLLTAYCLLSSILARNRAMTRLRAM